MKKILLFILFVLATFATEEWYYRQKLTQSPSTSTEKITFEITKGEPPKAIADALLAKNLITSKWAFLRYSKSKNFSSHFQAGYFSLSTNMTIPDLARALTHSQTRKIKLIILEGWTNDDIDIFLTDKALIARGDFLKCVAECNFSDFPFLPAKAELREGFFFPATYIEDPENFSVEDFAIRLLSTFDTRTKTLVSKSKRDQWDIVKMASIIEKETNPGEERPLVAGILWKRLDNGWMLGADATTRYITKKKTAALTVTDLNDKNEWNTRAKKGLPPGAISNPSLSAIKAAVNPVKSDFWFYLHDQNGQIHYGKTLTEHNQNKRDFL